MSQYPFRRLQTELAEMINKLPPETRLPSEPLLAKQMGVSRATLREAMRSFEGKGMIRRRQGVGTFVAAKVPVIETGLEVLESELVWIWLPFLGLAMVMYWWRRQHSRL